MQQMNHSECCDCRSARRTSHRFEAVAPTSVSKCLRLQSAPRHLRQRLEQQPSRRLNVRRRRTNNCGLALRRFVHRRGSPGRRTTERTARPLQGGPGMNETAIRLKVQNTAACDATAAPGPSLRIRIQSILHGSVDTVCVERTVIIPPAHSRRVGTGCRQPST